jgi:hypothetical protein
MPVINGEPLSDSDLIAWVSQLLVAIFGATLADPEPTPATP